MMWSKALVGGAALVVCAPPIISLIRPSPGSGATHMRPPKWMKDRVEQIALAAGMPEDKVRNLRVYQSSSTFGSSGGSMLLNTHWIALPRTSLAKEADELANLAPTGQFFIEGHKYPLSPGSNIHPALLGALLYSDARRDFVAAHELGHLLERHVESEAAGTALALVPLAVSLKLAIPPAALLVGGFAAAYGINELRSWIAKQREFEADAIAAKAGFQEGGKEHFFKSRDFELFGLQLARSPLVHQPELWGQDYSHPSFTARLKRLDQLPP